MSVFTPNDMRRTMDRLRWPLRWTRIGMIAEQAVRAFWPLMSVTLLVLAGLVLGLQDAVAVETVWALGAVSLGLALAALVYAARRFRVPSRDAAMARLDNSLPGRPLQALLD